MTSDRQSFRFVTFVSRPEEVSALNARHPDVDFSFASFASPVPAATTINPLDLRPFLDSFAEEHARRPFHGVLNRREKFVIPAVSLANHLGLRPIAAEPELLRDRYRMRRAIGACGRDGPVLVRGASDLASVPNDFFPAVLKPRFGFNSRAVVRVETRDELRCAFLLHHRLYSRLKREDGLNADFVVERWVEGTEHTVEAFVVDGDVKLCLVSDKSSMHPPYCVETGDVMPSLLDSGRQESLIDTARAAVRSLRVMNGWAHVEVKIGEAGHPFVVEVAGRMGGGYHGALIEAVYGLDRWAMLVDLHLRRLSLPVLEAKTVAVGRRVVANGVRHVQPVRSVARIMARAGARLLWPRTVSDIGRFVVGPPYGYKNTIFEYMTVHVDAATALRVASEVEHEARLIQVPIPPLLYRALHRLGGGPSFIDG